VGLLERYLAPWRRLPGGFWVLGGARFINRVGAFSLAFLSLYLTRVGHLSLGQAGTVLATFGALTIPSRLLGGWLAGRLGGRVTMAAGLAVTAAVQLGLGIFTGTVALAGGTLMLGLAFDIYEAPAAALVAGAVPVPARDFAFGALALVSSLAGVVAGGIAAGLAGLGLRWLFVVDGITSAAAAVVVTSLPGTPRGRPVSPGPSCHPSWWADRRLWLITGASTVFATLYLQVFLLLPLTLTERGQQPGAVGVVLMASSAVVLAGGTAGARRLARISQHRVLAAGYLAFGIGLGLNAFARSLHEFVLAAIVWASADLMIIGRLPAVVAAIAPAGSSARYLAIYGSSWGVAAVAAPLIGTAMLSRLGPMATWSAMGMACILPACTAMAIRTRPSPP
jgi:MFS family permease